MKKLAEETIEDYEKAIKETHPPSNNQKPFKEKKQTSYKSVNLSKLTKTERAYYERKPTEFLILTDNEFATKLSQLPEIVEPNPSHKCPICT